MPTSVSIAAVGTRAPGDAHFLLRDLSTPFMTNVLFSVLVRATQEGLLGSGVWLQLLNPNDFSFPVPL